jgi:hypothetical protein
MRKDGYQIIARADRPAQWIGGKVVSNTIDFAPDPDKTGVANLNPSMGQPKTPDKPETF